jgi:hypothetical protein
VAPRLTQILCALLSCVPSLLGCRERPHDGAFVSGSAHERAAPELGGGRAPANGAAPEGAPARDPLERVEPLEHTSQRLAFSRERLAWLRRGEVWVFGLPDLALVTRFRSPDARNVVALTGGGFLIAAQDHLQRLSAGERRPELLPRAPRIGPTTIVASRHEAAQFWLYYEGIASLPRFDLAAPSGVASLPVQSWTELPEFDRRALLGAGDGSFVYTTADGLRRIDVEGRRESLPQPELAGRIWALAPDVRLDRVWAATEQHLYLLHVRERAATITRHELPRHPVALASDAGTVAVLSVEALSASSARLRVDVYERGAANARVVHFVAGAPADPDAGAAALLRPAIALDAAGALFAVDAWGLQVHDYRRGVRLYPADQAAQKLAPGAP